MTFSIKNNMWKPSAEYLEEINSMTNMKISNFEKLVANIQDQGWLFEALGKQLVYNFIATQEKKPSFSKISINGKGNIIEKIVDINLEIKPNANTVAMVYYNSEDITQEITFEDLNKQISKVVAGLKDVGFKKGDVAVIAMPLIPEAIYAMLGIIKMGGVCVPIVNNSFESDNISKIVKETDAKIIFTVDSVSDNDSTLILKNNVDQAIKGNTNIEIVIIVNLNNEETGWKINRDVWWDDLIDNQQLEEPVDTINTAEPYMILILDVLPDKLKKNGEIEIGEMLKVLNKNPDFSSFYLLISFLIYSNLEESIKVK